MGSSGATGFGWHVDSSRAFSCMYFLATGAYIKSGAWAVGPYWVVFLALYFCYFFAIAFLSLLLLPGYASPDIAEGWKRSCLAAFCTWVAALPRSQVGGYERWNCMSWV